MSMITFCTDIARTSLVYHCTVRGIITYLQQLWNLLIGCYRPSGQIVLGLKRAVQCTFAAVYVQRTFLNVLPTVYLHVYLITIHYEEAGGMLSGTFHVMLWVTHSQQPANNQPCYI